MCLVFLFAMKYYTDLVLLIFGGLKIKLSNLRTSAVSAVKHSGGSVGLFLHGSWIARGMALVSSPVPLCRGRRSESSAHTWQRFYAGLRPGIKPRSPISKRRTYPASCTVMVLHNVDGTVANKDNLRVFQPHLRSAARLMKP
ncbi:hypothetical protein CHARACLAT_023927 [Characodon lateralis]|uniref:Secreted protein n=1 Tax=Characodon lateralis TaxID=208331 RepID=A0ABU7EMY3_9TELE|nr:hypothetical protein [Characodon lateralis]